jgi:phosphoribosylanthranilate isomerase
MIKLKACKVAHLTDARYFSAKGAAIMGFDLDPHSPDFVSPDKLHAIVEWVDGVELAGEFGMNSAEEIVHLSQTLNLEYIQLPHFADPATALELKDHKVIRQIALQKGDTASSIAGQITDWAPLVWAVELDFDPLRMDPFSGSLFSEEELNELLALQQIFIKGPFSAKSIHRIAELDQFPGLSFAGSEEEKTGFKSYEEIDEVLDYLESKKLYDPYGW